MNFEGGDLYKCKFGDVTVPAIFNRTRHEIICTAPAQPDTRGVIPLHVVIFNYADHRVHHRASKDRGFRYYDPKAPGRVPILVSISPSAGSVKGGTHVTIKGEGFVHTENLRCKFGSEIVAPRKYEPHRASHSSPYHADPAAVLSETMICVAPSYARQGVVPFRLQNLDGVLAARRLEFEYTVSLSSSSLSISTSTVPITGGVTLSIDSKSTLSKAMYRCRFGGRVVTRGFRVSKKRILCLVPAERSVMDSTTFQIVPNSDLFMGSFVHRKDVVSDVSQDTTDFWRTRQGESEVALFSRTPLSAFLELDPNITAPNVTTFTTPTLTSVLGDVELVLGNAFNRIASASLRDSDDSRRLVRGVRLFFSSTYSLVSHTHRNYYHRFVLRRTCALSCRTCRDGAYLMINKSRIVL